jgi:hypothetical protein
VGVVPHLVDGCILILQYADVMIIFMEHDLEKARNLKTNFSKSELFYFGEAQNEDASYVELFGPGIGICFITYLDIPIHYRRLTNTKWKHVKEKLQKQLRI